MAVLGRSRSGAPPDQILDPPLYLNDTLLVSDTAHTVSTH